MILEKLVNSPKLKSIIDDFISLHENVWDIGIYGSIIRGKIDINDIDIVIILKKILNINEKLKLSQDLKFKINDLFNEKIDIKCIDMNDLIDDNFLARAGIIAETFLIKNNKTMANLLGFGSFYTFEYTLKNLTKSEKQQFLYALNGRGSNKGLIKSDNLEHIGGGVLKVPLVHSEDIKEFFEKNKISYKIKKALIY